MPTMTFGQAVWVPEVYIDWLYDLYWQVCEDFSRQTGENASCCPWTFDQWLDDNWSLYFGQEL